MSHQVDRRDGLGAITVCVGHRDAVTSFIWRTPIDAGPSCLIIVYRESELTFICLCFAHYWSGIGWRDGALGATLGQLHNGSIVPAAGPGVRITPPDYPEQRGHW